MTYDPALSDADAAPSYARALQACVGSLQALARPTATVFYRIDASGEPVDFELFGMTAAMHRAYVSRYRPLDPLHPSRCASQPGAVVTLASQLPDERRDTSSYWTGFLRRHGVVDVVEVLLRDGGAVLAAFSLLRWRATAATRRPRSRRCAPSSRSSRPRCCRRCARCAGFAGSRATCGSRIARSRSRGSCATGGRTRPSRAISRSASRPSRRICCGCFASSAYRTGPNSSARCFCDKPGNRRWRPGGAAPVARQAVGCNGDVPGEHAASSPSGATRPPSQTRPSCQFALTGRETASLH